MRPLFIIAIALGLPLAADAADDIDFNRDIKPLLSSNCFKCHGPDEHERKADLRLDTFDGATADLDGSHAIVPGDLSASELLHRITSSDPDEVMPPPKSSPALKPEQAELFRRWIESGAKYERHWSFIPPVRPGLPAVKNTDWPRNAIDSFILARIESENLTPSPQADPHLLLRRVSLDLTGLPPQPADRDAFLAAWRNNPDAAYEKLVDDLLTSPAYGERWARKWLDLARYADSMGYASDNLRTIWGYRDWVIDALNRNMPFDEFTLAQMAGDLLPNATPEQRIATAFHRNSMNNTEGGTDNEEFRVAAVKDRINTTMQVWMGLTMGCAECHTHKYDPIKQSEYYQFYDYFNQTADVDTNDDFPTLQIPGTEAAKQRDELQAKIDALHKQLQSVTAEALAVEQQQWEAQYQGTTTWRPIEFSKLESLQKARLTVEADHAIFVTGPSPKNDSYTLTLAENATEKPITAFRLETLPDKRNPAGGSGRSPDGRFFLNRFAAHVDNGDQPLQGRFVRVTLPGKDKFLHLAEVEVFASDTNLASGGKASQSSTDYDGPAGNAIDGITDGDYGKNKTTHTAKENNPWWEVDLGTTAAVDRITVWNRNDGNTADRIAGYTIELLDEKRQVIWSEEKLPAPKKTAEFSTSGIRQLTFSLASADYATEKFPISSAIGKVSRNLSGWDVTPKQTEPHEAIFVLAAPLTLEKSETLTLTLDHHYNYGGQLTLGKFRLSVTSDSLDLRAKLPPNILTLIDLPRDQRSPDQAKKLADYFRGVAPSLTKLRNEIAVVQKQRDKIKPPTVPVLAELDRDKQRPTHIHIRGSFLDQGEQVKAAVPAAFHPFPAKAPQNRIGVAEWLTAPDNPLTARVAANRYWAQFFGRGIVETEEDFGAQGTYPSHPKLLDWLATEYVRLGWDTKALMKTIVMSATYQQASTARAEIDDKDPNNILLARGPRFRLEAEMVRDQALALAGLLVEKIGGPSVYPPQPPGLWRAAFNGADRTWPTSEGEDKYRRGVYTFWRRSAPYPSMATFDVPNREVCEVRRIRTNTPLQAFVTLNDPVYVEIAQAMARRIVQEGGDHTADRARFALQLLLVRPPTDAEITAVEKLHAEELAIFEKQSEDARLLATSELGDAPADANLPDLAAWTAVTNVLLNLDAVLSK